MNEGQNRRLRDAQRAKKRKDLEHALTWESEMFGYGDDKKTPTDGADIAGSPLTDAELFRSVRELSQAMSPGPRIFRTHWRRRLLKNLIRCKKASAPKDMIARRGHLYFNFTSYKY